MLSDQTKALSREIVEAEQDRIDHVRQMEASHQEHMQAICNEKNGQQSQLLIHGK